MGLEQCMNVLLKNMQKQDAKIEEDMRQYAGLLSELERCEALRKQHEADKHKLVELFSALVDKSTYEADSIHFQRMQETIKEDEETRNRILGQIEERKSYYEAFQDNAYEVLWKQDEAGQLAAIYLMFGGKKRSVQAMTAELLGKKKNLSPEVSGYLIDKALVYSDERQEEREEEEKLEELLTELLRSTDYPTKDETWKSRESYLKIRKTRRTLAECKILLEKYDNVRESFEGFEENYERIRTKIEAELGKLKSGKKGDDATLCISKTKQWYRSSIAEINEKLTQGKKQNEEIKHAIAQMNKMSGELQQGRKAGADMARCDSIHSSLTAYSEKLAGYTDVSEMENMLEKLLSEFQKKMGLVQEAKQADTEKRKRVQRKKVQNWGKRKKYMMKAMPVMVVCVILFIIYRLFFSNVYYGFGKFYFGNRLYKEYVVSSRVKEIPDGLFRNNHSMVSVTLPEGLKEIGNQAFMGCSSLQELVLPESMETIGESAFENCYNLQTVAWNDNLTAIGSNAFASTDLQSLEDLNLTIADEKAFYNCKNLEITEEIEEKFGADKFYKRAFPEEPLLENEGQLKKILPGNYISGIDFTDKEGTISNLWYEKEKTQEAKFSFEYRLHGLWYAIAGSVISNNVNTSLPQDIRLNISSVQCGYDKDQLLIQDEEGNYPGVAFAMDGLVLPLGEEEIVMNGNDITNIQIDEISEEEQKITFVLSAKLKSFRDIDFSGCLELSVGEDKPVREFNVTQTTDNGYNFYGTYTDSNENTVVVNQRQGNYYYLGDGNFLDVSLQNKGNAVIYFSYGEYSTNSHKVTLDYYNKEIHVKDNYVLKKTANTEEEKETDSRFAGVWKGSLRKDLWLESHNVAYTAYVFDNGENDVAMIEWNYTLNNGTLRYASYPCFWDYDSTNHYVKFTNGGFYTVADGYHSTNMSGTLSADGKRITRTNGDGYLEKVQ